MEVVFSAQKRKKILHIPIPPTELEISFPHQNITIDTANGGQLKIIGESGLKSISFESWIPTSKKYSFVKSKVLASELKNFFTTEKRNKRPVRLVLTYKNGYELHNEEYAIDDFTFGYNVTGDMTYKLSLESLG